MADSTETPDASTPAGRKAMWHKVINHLKLDLGLHDHHPAVLAAREEAAAQGVDETP